MKHKFTGKIFVVLLVIFFCIFAVFPFMWMISSSFKPSLEIYTLTPVYPAKSHADRLYGYAFQQVQKF
jgi:ABC-type glycerol-3-phosphate transport system permease component